MAATRRRRVAGAAGHEERKSTTVSGLAGSADRSVTAQWSVNSAQSPAYAARVRADNTLPVGAVPISIVVVMAGSEAEAGDGVADQGGVFAGVDLEHHRGAVPGLPHDRVGVGAGPGGLGDEPGAQRVPAELVDLGGVNPAAAPTRSCGRPGTAPR